MFIISLYHIDLLPLPHNPQSYLYGQSQINHIILKAISMGKVKSIILTDSERLSLETGFRQGLSHCFRMRCRAVLLKSSGLSSKQVGLQTEMSHVSVNFWVKRFMQEGISGLQTRPGRGRKPIMDCTDEEVVRKAIEQDRQSVSKARDAWQKATGKEASDLTFKRFLSALAQDISE